VGVARTGAPAEVFRASLKLGLTSFGGPIAHLGYFERTYVRQLRWLSATDYAGIVALCQLLPGPSSSQVGFLIGYHRAGWRGALAAWAGFTLPSALLMYGFALYASRAEGAALEVVVHGLMLTAVPVVAQAVWSMTRSLCPDWRRKAIAILALVVLLFHGSASLQLAAMLIGALGGWLLCRGVPLTAPTPPAGLNLRHAWLLVAVAGAALLGLPVLAMLDPRGPIAFTNIFYRAGALVFGGGHVVLPILRDALVPSGWISDRTFLTGYGFAQAIPGPLFTFAAYLGALSAPGPLPGLWAAVALFAIFLPGLMLAVAGMSLWGRLGGSQSAQAVISGINAAVVGVLGAALYNPVSTTALHGGVDVGVAVTGFVLLERWRAPPILVVALCVIVSAAG
jgi:chromate transporter